MSSDASYAVPEGRRMTSGTCCDMPNKLRTMMRYRESTSRNHSLVSSPAIAVSIVSTSGVVRNHSVMKRTSIRSMFGTPILCSSESNSNGAFPYATRAPGRAVNVGRQTGG